MVNIYVGSLPLLSNIEDESSKAQYIYLDFAGYLSPFGGLKKFFFMLATKEGHQDMPRNVPFFHLSSLRLSELFQSTDLCFTSV